MASAAEQLACQHQSRRLLQGDRAQEAHLVHPRRADRLPPRHLYPAARHRLRDAAGTMFQQQCRRHPRHVRHVLRRRARAHDDLRAEHHAVHLRLDHHPADDRGLADARSAEERRRERAARSSTSTPATAPCCSPWSRPTASRSGSRACAARRLGGDRSGPVLPLHHRHHAGRRHHVPDVARRADHRARHRQRHLADHLRRHRRQPAARAGRRPSSSAAPARSRPSSSSSSW